MCPWIIGLVIYHISHRHFGSTSFAWWRYEWPVASPRKGPGMRSFCVFFLVVHCGVIVGFNLLFWFPVALSWRHNGRSGVSNHRRLNCFLNFLFRRRSQKISKLLVTGLCEGNSPVTGEFPAQRASNAENVSTWRRHHGLSINYDNVANDRTACQYID